MPKTLAEGAPEVDFLGASWSVKLLHRKCFDMVRTLHELGSTATKGGSNIEKDSEVDSDDL